jgi:hypothetical protein
MPPRSAATAERTVPTDRITRRTAIRHGGALALGAVAVWSAPSVRTTMLRADGHGTPQPEPPHVGPAHVDPNAVAAAEEASGRLPFTGIDPKPLLLAGGAAVGAGAALLAVAQDPEPSRGED